MVPDIYKPNGAWKVEANGVYVEREGAGMDFHTFAAPQHVAALMDELLAVLNQANAEASDLEQGLGAYSKLHVGFVSVHPFWDGTGRMARLVANLPMLNAGFPPLVMHRERRPEYIRLLAAHQREIGDLAPERGVWPKPEALAPLHRFFQSCHETAVRWVDDAFRHQRERERKG